MVYKGVCSPCLELNLHINPFPIIYLFLDTWLSSTSNIQRKLITLDHINLCKRILKLVLLLAKTTR